jgi:hypothetical protein
MESKLHSKVAHQLKLLKNVKRHHPNLKLGGAEKVEEATPLWRRLTHACLVIVAIEDGCLTKSSNEGNRR